MRHAIEERLAGVVSPQSNGVHSHLKVLHSCDQLLEWRKR